ncbi:MAG: hypothetical protein HY922_11605 [Elusimicrobia bacterium]|nr:hypothetical protein [Elusimicrobiota bacterium]
MLLADAFLKTGLEASADAARRRALDMTRGRGESDVSNLPNDVGSIRPNLRRSEDLDVTGAGDRLYADIKSSRLVPKLEGALERCLK